MNPLHRSRWTILGPSLLLALLVHALAVGAWLVSAGEGEPSPGLLRVVAEVDLVDQVTRPREKKPRHPLRPRSIPPPQKLSLSPRPSSPPPGRESPRRKPPGDPPRSLKIQYPKARVRPGHRAVAMRARSQGGSPEGELKGDPEGRVGASGPGGPGLGPGGGGGGAGGGAGGTLPALLRLGAVRCASCHAVPQLPVRPVNLEELALTGGEHVDLESGNKPVGPAYEQKNPYIGDYTLRISSEGELTGLWTERTPRTAKVARMMEEFVRHFRFDAPGEEVYLKIQIRFYPRRESG